MIDARRQHGLRYGDRTQGRSVFCDRMVNFRPAVVIILPAGSTIKEDAGDVAVTADGAEYHGKKGGKI